MNELRDYQKTSINQVKALFSKGDREVVLAMCPGSGKTLTSCSLIRDFDCRTLILAHGTSVLRHQWSDRLKEYNIEFSHDINSSAKVIMNLPQSLYKEVDLASFDLVVVDEAHEFYLADMVQTIIQRCKPSKVLLLTGTPSKFIRNKTPMVVVSAEDILKTPDSDKYISDVYFGIAHTHQTLAPLDFNSQGDLKEDVEVQQVEESLENLIESIGIRLSQINSTEISSKLGAKEAFDRIGKTLIACNNIRQAGEIQSYLISRGIKCISSNSDNDPNSDGISLFKSDSSVNVLIVVNRGVLGFDFSDLHNVVDMTLSKNIDRMYQLYARVMRPKEGVRKLFFKIIPIIQSDMYKFYMTASISLLRSDVMSQYDGTNLTSIKIPTIINSESGARSDGEKVKSRPVNMSGNKPLESLFNGNISVANLMLDISSKVNDLTEIAYVTLSELKHNEYGRRPWIVGVDEHTLVKYLQTGELDPIVYTDKWDTGLPPVFNEVIVEPYGIRERKIPFVIENRGKSTDRALLAYFSKFNSELLDEHLPKDTSISDRLKALYNSEKSKLPIKCLAPGQQKIFRMIVIKGLTQSEAAAKLGINQSGVSQQLELAENKLRLFCKARNVIKDSKITPDRVKLYYIDFLTTQEIADKLGITQAGVNMSLRRWRLDNGID